MDVKLKCIFSYQRNSYGKIHPLKQYDLNVIFSRSKIISVKEKRVKWPFATYCLNHDKILSIKRLNGDYFQKYSSR